MENVLYIKVCEVTDQIYDFNDFKYRLVTCCARTDAPFDTLVPIEINLKTDDVIYVDKCKIVRIDYEADYTRVAVRLDKIEICEPDHEISRYFNIPFVGMVKRRPEMHPKTYGPDKTKFYRVQLQMRDAERKPFIINLLGYNNKAVLLDSFNSFSVIVGIATLKHKNGCERYELALCEAESYKE